MPGRCRAMGGVKVCASGGQKTGKREKKKPQRPNCRGAFLCFDSLQLESSNIQFDGPLNRENFLVLTVGKVHMFGSRCLLTKTNDSDLGRRFSPADSRTRRGSTAHHPEQQRLVCVEFTVGGGGREEQKYGRWGINEK